MRSDGWCWVFGVGIPLRSLRYASPLRGAKGERFLGFARNDSAGIGMTARGDRNYRAKGSGWR